MATLVFTALGSALGGPLFAAAGAIAGGAIDAAIVGSPTREGPRLTQLAVTTSSYGDPLPRHFGRMRVAGSVIWATDLAEHSQTSGGGKGKPKLKTYSYSCSFAVALASRPIHSVGRIWADGNLLRGEDGALKVGGAIRVHLGHGDQAADPLIVAAEGARSPAWRGLAYVVFENLQLADFGNRIPTLTFEIFADDGPLVLEQVLAGTIPALDAGVALDGVDGLSLTGSPAELLSTLMPAFPLTCDASGERLAIAAANGAAGPRALGEPAVSSAKGDFGAYAGYVRQRGAPDEAPPRILRYYDIDRDFQPGAQRAGGRPLPGQPRAIDLPVAMQAPDARRLIARAAHSSGWARETLQWRSTELDPDVGPGALVSAPGQTGTWRVMAWEWRERGIELALERVSAVDIPQGAASAGRALVAADLSPGATALLAFELPWDGTGSGDDPLVFAAASSASAGWAGAELSLVNSGGALVPLAATGRGRAILGATVAALGPASPHLLDRENVLEVDLIGDDMALAGATVRQLAEGANRALVGDELVQFATVTALGNGRWRLGHLLRGRGGTEDRIGGHVAGEPFVLLDDSLPALDPAVLGSAPELEIAAIGLADSEPVITPVRNRGLTLRPLAPVHGRVAASSDGLALRWMRRARGAWRWADGVDAPLHEQAEAYEITFERDGTVAARWETGTPALFLDAGQVAALRTALPGGALMVRQRGTYALSPALRLTTIS